MKTLFYECFSGISGDMNLGAMIDLGVPREHLESELAKLDLGHEFHLEVNKGFKQGIGGTKVDVILHNHHHDHHHHHEHDHSHEQAVHHHHHEHDHSHEQAVHHHHHEHDHSHEQADHHHRSFRDIRNLIEASKLEINVKKLATDIFLHVAEAEAQVHGKSIDEVHFHEVGAVDSIVDIVGAAICFEYIKPDKVVSTTVKLGGGYAKCDHGVMPVPAPATAKILEGIPSARGPVDFELTTPTGAAILKAIVDEYNDSFEYSTVKSGYGLGTKDFEVPNMLRVSIVEEKKKAPTQLMLETNIDDMNQELYEYVESKLFEAGALDVYKTQIIMKKGRPAVKLSILYPESKRKDIHEVIFTETTSAGAREYPVTKYMLSREMEKLHTHYGDISVKVLYYDSVRVNAKPEYEEMKKIAKEKGVPLKKLYEEINALIGGK